MQQGNWQKLIYYGEVFGFLFAWAVGLALVMSGSQDPPSQPGSKVARVAADATAAD